MFLSFTSTFCIFFFPGVTSKSKYSKCSLGVVKEGYTIKGGLLQDNIRTLGNSSSVASCSRECCRHDDIEFGLYDGLSCYGVSCASDTDKRCVLLGDGNMRFKIFQIKRKLKSKTKKKKRSKGQSIL